MADCHVKECGQCDLGLWQGQIIDTYATVPPEGEGYNVLPLFVPPSVRPKIFFVAFFSATIDGSNLIFGHKLHIGMPYCGTRQVPTSCLPT